MGKNKFGIEKINMAMFLLEARGQLRYINIYVTHTYAYAYTFARTHTHTHTHTRYIYIVKIYIRQIS